MRSKKTSIFLCAAMIATVFAVLMPSGTGSAVEVDAQGPYGTEENPICVGDPISFVADITGGNIADYRFRWDVDGDGFFDGPGGPDYWGAYGENSYAHTFATPYTGQVRVEAWDGISYNGGEPDSITDTADVYVINCPVRMLEDLKDLINFFDSDDFSSPNAQKKLNNKINAILNSLDLNDKDSILSAIDKLKNDILPKTDGEKPPKDWVSDPAAQQALEDKINEIIQVLQELADEL